MPVGRLTFPKYDVCSYKTNYGLQGICGPNAYCTVSEDNRANCRCPDGYVPVDQQRPYKGCRTNFVPDSCDGKNHSSGEFTTAQMPTIAWSDRSIYKNYPITMTSTSQQCNALCMVDCFCVAVSVNGTNCMFMGMLTAGRYLSNSNIVTYIKVRSSIPIPFKAPLRSIMLYTAIGILAFLHVVSITYLLRQRYLSNKAKRSSLGLIAFSYKELDRATGGFHLKMMLGKGGFGRVYKGEVSYLQPPHVAVKTLIESNEYTEEGFGNEMGSMGQIHHKNLVRMIGYCKQGAHRMLVFEYMQGGTLADFIFASKRPCWSCLAEAAIGIARGLEYLHEGCKSKIIHCDIKPDNILFDDNHTPRITDFGIAKLLGGQKTQHTITTVAGTRAYLAPEWFHGEGSRVDSMVDVYSFGVVLLEMICCKKASVEGPSDSRDPGAQPNLRAWAESLIRSGRAEKLVQGEREALADMESVERFACVAIWCLQKDPSIRPKMRRVVQMLEGTTEVDPLPDPPRSPSFSAILSTPTSSVTLHSSSRVHVLHVE